MSNEPKETIAVPSRELRLELCNDPPSDGPICFYEVRCYWLSNFSAFAVLWRGNYYPTSEHAYQSAKFPLASDLHEQVRTSPSAHEAMLLARREVHITEREFGPGGWDNQKREVMKTICRQKLRQHPYIRKKLPLTGERELIEVSPVDSYWGWGPNRDGRNELGKIWMELREEMRAEASK